MEEEETSSKDSGVPEEKTSDSTASEPSKEEAAAEPAGDTKETADDTSK